MNTTDIKDTAEDLEEQAQEWKEAAREWKQSAIEGARNAAQSTHQYVRENVWSTLAVAVVVGCTLGFLLGRSRD
jgi:ElaB/YqjD/DUF883 family membrane-anchored ribosome-binding protein